VSRRTRTGSTAALAALVALVLLVPGAPLAAQERAEPRILDLEYRVEDLSGRVQDLDIRETATEIRIDMAADVLFAFDKADLQKTAMPVLEKVAAVLAQHPKVRVSIEGHTDGKGSADYNQRLSERRASSVGRWLQAKPELKAIGIGFTPRGFGATKPVAPNTKPDGSDDPDGRQKNRRVEIVVQKV
jgi:outer membrane protein OmpA-like peptidoglycan-associated protein